MQNPRFIFGSVLKHLAIEGCMKTKTGLFDASNLIRGVATAITIKT